MAWGYDRLVETRTHEEEAVACLELAETHMQKAEMWQAANARATIGLLHQSIVIGYQLAAILDELRGDKEARR